MKTKTKVSKELNVQKLINKCADRYVVTGGDAEDILAEVIESEYPDMEQAEIEHAALTNSVGLVFDKVDERARKQQDDEMEIGQGTLFDEPYPQHFIPNKLWVMPVPKVIQNLQEKAAQAEQDYQSAMDYAKDKAKDFNSCKHNLQAVITVRNIVEKHGLDTSEMAYCEVMQHAKKNQ